MHRAQGETSEKTWNMLYGMDVCRPRELVIAGDTRGNLHFADPRDASVLGALQAHKKGNKVRPGLVPVLRLWFRQRGRFCHAGFGWLPCGALCARALCVSLAVVCQLCIDRCLGQCSSSLPRCEASMLWQGEAG